MHPEHRHIDRAPGGEAFLERSSNCSRRKPIDAARVLLITQSIDVPCRQANAVGEHVEHTDTSMREMQADTTRKTHSEHGRREAGQDGARPNDGDRFPCKIFAGIVPPAHHPLHSLTEALAFRRHYLGEVGEELLYPIGILGEEILPEPSLPEPHILISESLARSGFQRYRLGQSIGWVGRLWLIRTVDLIERLTFKELDPGQNAGLATTAQPTLSRPDSPTPSLGVQLRVPEQEQTAEICYII